jgi:hypothetical protein
MNTATNTNSKNLQVGFVGRGDQGAPVAIANRQLNSRCMESPKQDPICARAAALRLEAARGRPAPLQGRSPPSASDIDLARQDRHQWIVAIT